MYTGVLCIWFGLPCWLVMFSMHSCLTGHMYMSAGERPIRILCPFIIVFYSWVVFFTYWYKLLIIYAFCRYCLLLHEFSHLMVFFEAEKVFKLDDTSIYLFFLLLFVLLVSQPKKIIAKSNVMKFCPMLSSKTLIVLAFAFRCLIYIELIFIQY